VTQSHDAIDELLAGYVLRSLSGPDAAETDRLLTEHVPGCVQCKTTLEAFGAVTADLALATPAIRPPDTLLPRLHRELEPRSGRAGRTGRWSPARLVAAAAGFVLVLGVGGLALTQLGGGDVPALASADLQQALQFATQDGATTTDIGPAHEIAAPGVEEFYIYGTNVAQPPAGSVYRLWVQSATQTVHLGDFLPTSDGTVLLRVAIDPTAYDRVMVTVEPADSEASEPGEPAWEAA